MTRDHQDPPAATRFVPLPQGSGVTLMRSTDPAVCRAYHVSYVVCVIYRGANEWRYRDRQWCSGPGHPVMLMEPGEWHVTTAVSPGPVRFSVMLLDPATMAEYALREGLDPTGVHLDNSTPFASEVFRAFTRLDQAASNFASANDRFELDMRLAEGIDVVLRGATERQNTTPSNWDNKRAVIIAIDYLRANLGQPIRGDELAAAAGVASRAHLVRVFRATTGMAPHEFHNHLRLAHAIRRLRRGDPIIDVAMELGFSDQSHLARVLRRHYGVRPRDVRANA